MRTLGLAVCLVVALCSGCPSDPGCIRNSDCPAGSYCSGGACATDCTPATVEDDCDPGEVCNTFGMCVGGMVDAGLDGGSEGDAPTMTDAGLDAPSAPDAPDAPDLRPACVIAGGTDGDGDGYCDDIDCDDAEASVSPGAAEVCTTSTATTDDRAIDEDCDAAIDEGCSWHFGTPHPVLLWDADADAWDFETPRVSSDGLRLYVRGGDATGNAVLVMSRPSVAMPFGPPAVVPGLGPTTGISSVGLSSDELEAYLQAVGAGGRMDLFRATRATTSAPFGTMVAVAPVNDPAEHEYHPFVRVDGLELLFGSGRGGGGLLRASRSSPTGAWSTPVPLSFAGTARSAAANSPALSADGRTLFFADVAGTYSLFMASRASPDDAAFTTPVAITELNATGAATLFPVVSERTAEIFFLSDRPWSAGRARGLWRARICRDGPCPAETISCPAPAVRSEDGLHCYTRGSGPDTQGNATAACLAAGGHLLTLQSEAERALVWRTFGSSASVAGTLWVGASDAAMEGVWTWSTGEPFSYAPWQAPDPNGGVGENGAVLWWMFDGFLGDYATTGSFAYVCETEMWPTW